MKMAPCPLYLNLELDLATCIGGMTTADQAQVLGVNIVFTLPRCTGFGFYLFYSLQYAYSV